jgi:hypothetical protein
MKRLLEESAKEFLKVRTATLAASAARQQSVPVLLRGRSADHAKILAEKPRVKELSPKDKKDLEDALEAASAAHKKSSHYY